MIQPGMTVEYLGELRCEATHLRSGNTLITDAPPDNKGRGEAFSPTDLLCTSLAACMMTIMGITAREKEIPLEKMHVAIEKVMASDPRRVTAIRLAFDIQADTYSDKQLAILKNAAMTCPVAKSIHPDIHIELHWK
jgi:putative redox protein